MSGDDPEALKRRIAELERQLAAATGSPPVSSANTATGSHGIAAEKINLVIQGSVFGDILNGSAAATRKQQRTLLTNYLLGLRE